MEVRHDHRLDVASDAYFYTSGYRTDGANLDERLKSYAKRHHVVPRTALRRSDRGARAIAQLVREDMRYDRPWAYLIAAQDGGLLHVFMRVTVDPGNDLVPPAIQINGERLGDTELKLIPRDDDARDTYRVEIPPIQLNTNVDASEPLAKVAMAWFPGSLQRGTSRPRLLTSVCTSISASRRFRRPS